MACQVSWQINGNYLDRYGHRFGRLRQGSSMRALSRSEQPPAETPKPGLRAGAFSGLTRLGTPDLSEILFEASSETSTSSPSTGATGVGLHHATPTEETTGGFGSRCFTIARISVRSASSSTTALATVSRLLSAKCGGTSPKVRSPHRPRVAPERPLSRGRCLR